jgi:hypothetical protein
MVARVLRRLNELSHIPLSKPVTITQSDLDESNNRYLSVDRETGRPIDPDTNKVVEEKTLADAPISRPLTQPASEGRERHETAEDRGTHHVEPGDLVKRLKMLEASEAEAKQRAATAEETARQTTARAQHEVTQARAQAEEAQVNTVLVALGNAQTEIDAAKAAYTAAASEGNWAQAAEAQARMASAAADLAMHQRAKDAYDAKAEEAKRNPPRQTTQAAPTTAEQRIAAMQGLIPEERTFLLQHPELVMDRQKNVRLEAAWLDANDQGLRRGSPQFMQYIEQRLGFRQERSDDDVNTFEPDNRESGRRVNTSAPVSRDGVNLTNGRPRPNNGSIMLSPEEREIARNSGLTDIEYARQKVILQEHKAAGRIQQGY